MTVKRRKIKVPNDKMRVFILAPKILGGNIFAAQATFISAPGKNKKMLMSIDVEGELTLQNLAEMARLQ